MNASPPDAIRPALTHEEIRSIVLGILLAMFLAALDQTIVATALPTIGRDSATSNSCPGSSPPICSPQPR